METGGLADALREAVEEPIVVLCVGNSMRGDDGFGPAVAARLGNRPEVIDAGTTPENELPRVARRSPRTVLVVDAVHFDGRPGELRLVRPEDLRSDDLSTHAGSLDLCARFIKEACGARTVLLAAQPVGVGLGSAISAPLQEAVDQAVALIRTVLEDQRPA